MVLVSTLRFKNMAVLGLGPVVLNPLKQFCFLGLLSKAMR